jgi:hypothetical protein
MSNILFGFALISASLQTGWAFFAEGQLLALSVVMILPTVGEVAGNPSLLQTAFPDS